MISRHALPCGGTCLTLSLGSRVVRLVIPKGAPVGTGMCSREEWIGGYFGLRRIPGMYG